MDVASHIQIIRQRLDDRVEPYMVSDDAILHEINRVRREFAAELLPLSTTQSLFYSANNPLVLAPENLIKVRDLWASNLNKVQITTLVELLPLLTDDYGLQIAANWMALTGMPRYAITDFQTGYFRLVPTPIEAGTLTLLGYVYPEDLELSDADDEFLPRWQDHFHESVLATLFHSHDYELENPQMAQQWAAKWQETLFKARSEIERNTRGPGTVRFNSRGVW